MSSVSWVEVKTTVDLDEVYVWLIEHDCLQAKCDGIFYQATGNPSLLGRMYFESKPLATLFKLRFA